MPPERGGTIPGWLDKILFGTAMLFLLLVILCIYLYVASLPGGQ